MVGGATVLLLDIARRVFRHVQLFVPSRDPVKSWNPDDYGIPRERVTEHWFETPDGEMLYGWYCRAENPVASGVFCHGNTGNLTTSAAVIGTLVQSGFNVLMFDYRGFGKSTGRPSFTGVIADGVTAARFHDSIRPKELPSLLYGFSLGGAVAAQVIRHHAFDGLILQSTFTSLPDVARAVWPRLPLHFFAGNYFDTRSSVARLSVPLLVLHGAADEVVPVWMAHTLHDACATPKIIHIIDGGLHKDIYERDAASIVAAIHRFIVGLPHVECTVDIVKPSAIDHAIDAAFRAVRRQLRRRVRHAV
jgi:uncharacterized protein